ncbi:hypothetical protein HMN09_00378800 [Mycena chlorophos]|uniref:DUF6589 domain-containing protein n=1 Tax=Mycena chlorophos TaxID=658473 RepID=A0A8H6TL48_MYCCL|nr:hypothetical protein HMN09_00378800 [Mycena chlorophos]
MDNLDFLHVDDDAEEQPESDDDGSGPVNARAPADSDVRRSIHGEHTAHLRAALGNTSVLADVLDVLAFMKTTRINILIFLDALLWGDGECISDATCRFARAALLTSECFPSMLECCHTPPKTSTGTRPTSGHDVLEKFSQECVERTIDAEMEMTARFFASPQEDLTAKNLVEVDFGELKAEISATAPTLWSVLRTAAYRPKQAKRNKQKNPDMVVLHMISQAQYTRSNRRAQIAKLWSLYLKACSVPVRAFDALHAIGLVMSHKWTVEALKKLSDTAMELIRQFIHLYPWLITHDNINIAMRIFSQRLDNKGKFISGCAFTIYLLPSRAMLSEMLNREVQAFRAERATEVFDLEDVFYGASDADLRLQHLDKHHVLRILLDCPAFADYSDPHHSTFDRPQPTYALKTGPENAVKMFLLCTNEIDESSYDGTLKVIDDVFRQLGINSMEEQCKTATKRFIAWIGDQLTVERLRGLWKFRHEDHNSFNRPDFMVPIFGWFHVLMAFANSLHKQFLCNSATTGSLRHAFDLLKRKGLVTASTKGPFWHHLHEALHHISEAHIRACWLEVGRVKSLADLKSKSPAQLQELAEKLVLQFASRAALNEIDLAPDGEKDEVFREWTMFLVGVLPYLHL